MGRGRYAVRTDPRGRGAPGRSASMCPLSSSTSPRSGVGWQRAQPPSTHCQGPAVCGPPPPNPHLPSEQEAGQAGEEPPQPPRASEGVTDIPGLSAGVPAVTCTRSHPLTQGTPSSRLASSPSHPAPGASWHCFPENLLALESSSWGPLRGGGPKGDDLSPGADGCLLWPGLSLPAPRTRPSEAPRQVRRCSGMPFSPGPGLCPLRGRPFRPPALCRRHGSASGAWQLVTGQLLILPCHRRLHSLLSLT